MIDISMSIALENELIALGNELEGVGKLHDRCVAELTRLMQQVDAIAKRISEIDAVMDGLRRCP